MKRTLFLGAVLAILGAVFWSPPVPAASTVTRYEETNAAIVYSSTWLPIYGPGWSGGSAKYVVWTWDTRPQATFTFTGTGVSWIGYSGRYGGFVVVTLDGSVEAVFDTYSATEELAVPIYTKTSLAPGSHTLTIELTGARNPLAVNSETAVDAFDVYH